MGNDWIDLLSLFDRHGVRYLIVGGWAVMFYTQPRATKDLDLYVDSERANVERAYRALVEFGAPLGDLTIEDMATPGTIYQIGQPPFRVDILNALSGVDFARAWEAKISDVEQTVPVQYVGKDDLIANKIATGRLQDLADVQHIQDAEKALAAKHPEKIQ